jgi:hypothetical protein
VIRRVRLVVVVVVAFLIGCADLLTAGASGVRAEASQEEKQGRAEATKEQKHSGGAAPEEARCEETRTIFTMGFDYTTNDVPGCPQGGVLSGTDGQKDLLYAGVGEDEVRGLGGDDELWGGADGDVMYGGPGSDLLESSGKRSGDRSKDVLYGGEGGDTMFGDEGEDVLYGEDGDDFLGGSFDGRQRDKLYCGNGTDEYSAEKIDHVFGSCEKGRLVDTGGPHLILLASAALCSALMMLRHAVRSA